MAADFVAEAGGALEVDGIAGLQGAEVGFGEGFGHQVEAHLVAVDFGDGEAAAVVGYGSADLQVFGHVFGQLDGVAAKIGAGCINSADSAHALYDAGKHILSFCGVGLFQTAFIGMRPSERLIGVTGAAVVVLQA